VLAEIDFDLGADRSATAGPRLGAGDQFTEGSGLVQHRGAGNGLPNWLFQPFEPVGVRPLHLFDVERANVTTEVIKILGCLTEFRLGIFHVDGAERVLNFLLPVVIGRLDEGTHIRELFGLGSEFVALFDKQV
jgi:hypothetical protein